jgi:hypothetical protein
MQPTIMAYLLRLLFVEFEKLTAAITPIMNGIRDNITPLVAVP